MKTVFLKSMIVLSAFSASLQGMSESAKNAVHAITWLYGRQEEAWRGGDSFIAPEKDKTQNVPPAPVEKLFPEIPLSKEDLEEALSE